MEMNEGRSEWLGIGVLYTVVKEFGLDGMEYVMMPYQWT